MPWLDLAGIASLRPPAKLRNMDHPPAAVAGDVDVEVGHWSLSDEAVEVFTHEHEIGNAPVQRSSGHDAIVAAAVDASLWLGKPARPAPARVTGAGLSGVGDSSLSSSGVG